MNWNKSRGRFFERLLKFVSYAERSLGFQFAEIKVELLKFYLTILSFLDINWATAPNVALALLQQLQIAH